MSITTINSTMQAQIMQDVQRMQANAQAPVLPAMTFSSTDPEFHRPGRFVSPHYAGRARSR